MKKLKALLLTEGMHGMISQVEGMAKALNAEYDHKVVRLSFPWNLIPPFFINSIFKGLRTCHALFFSIMGWLI